MSYYDYTVTVSHDGDKHTGVAYDRQGVIVAVSPPCATWKQARHAVKRRLDQLRTRRETQEVSA